MIDYKKKYLKYKKKYLQAKNIYGGMDPGDEENYEWNPKGYFENLGPDLSKYIDSETKWYKEWPETQEWRLTKIREEDVNNDLPKKISYDDNYDSDEFNDVLGGCSAAGKRNTINPKKNELCTSFVFGYENTPNTGEFLNIENEEPYAEIIFTRPHPPDSGWSDPKVLANNQKRTLIKNTIKDISNNMIINMHLLNAQWVGTKYFNKESSNQEGNVVLGSSQANKNHEHYEKKITTLANNCDKWNTYIRKKNIGTDMNKIAVQTSTYVPNQFLYDENNKPYSNKGFILKIRLIQINNDGSLIPLNPQDVVNEWYRVRGWHNADIKEHPATLLKEDYKLFNKYGMYVMINWPNPTIPLLLFPESEEIEEFEPEAEKIEESGIQEALEESELQEALEQSKIYEEERKKHKQIKETIKEFVNMGFSLEKVENAFVKFEGNEEAIINYLLNN